MAWRNQGVTGSNNIPLGSRRRFGGDQDAPSNDGGYDQAPPPARADSGVKRGRSPAGSVDVDVNAAIDGIKRRKKRNRWGDAQENKAAGLMGLPTAIMANMTSEQLEAYTLHLRIEEISQKLRINDVVPAEGDRSPSPPPQYDNMGKRINTREYRYRKRLEEERHKLIEKAMKIIPDYHPPSDYRRPTKTQEKVYVPVNDYPEINFIGLLIGPRGNTLKNMETESLAKIAIRGKGSVKEGKGRSDAAHTSNQEEDLHCLIMADTEDKVNTAKRLIHNVIETAASIPEGQNSLKRNQLRELAALNGTLRDDENQACQNCGEIGHRKYDCPQQRNFTANIICRVCGNAGHMARDCPERQRGANWRNDAPQTGRPRIGGPGHEDDEYANLMTELEGGGSGGAIGTGAAPQRIEGGPGGDNLGGDRDAKPWQRGPTGAAAPWRSEGGGGRGAVGGPAPWRNESGGGAAPWRNDSGGGGPAPWARRDDRDGGRPPWAGGRGGRDEYGGGGYGGRPQQQYNGAGGGAPWNQGGPQARQDYGGHGGHQPLPDRSANGQAGYGQGYGYGAYDQGSYGHNMGPPPHGNYQGVPPPPPNEDVPPPPPPSDLPPPPPPPA